MKKMTREYGYAKMEKEGNAKHFRNAFRRIAAGAKRRWRYAGFCKEYRI